jgi:hypothetical protein
MKQDEILEALHKVVQENKHYTTWTVSTPHLVALVNLAIEQEREACAKIVEESSLPDTYSQECLPEIANDIRARGDKHDTR